MIQAGASMHRLAAYGHPTPCHTPSKAAVGASAARTAPCSRVAAFRDAAIPHSCSVDTAHAVVTSSSAGDTVHDGAQQAAALPWQPLKAGSALSRAAGSTYHAVEAAAAVAATAAEAAHVATTSEHTLLQQHHLLVAQQHAQPQQHHDEQQQLEHVVPHHSRPQHSQSAAAAAAAGQAVSPAETWLSQHSAAVAQWRLLSEHGQDETSAVILSCSSVQQLLGVAERLLAAPVSKWHYARLAAMAAVLGAQQLNAHSSSWAQPVNQHQHQQTHQQGHQQGPQVYGAPGVQQLAGISSGVGSNGSSSSRNSSSPRSYQQHQQKQHVAQSDQQDVSVSLQLACRVLEAVTCPCIDTGAPAVHSMRGAHLSEALHAVQLLLTQVNSTQLHPQQQSLLQLQQQRLQQQLARMSDALLLSAIHGCSAVDQLHSVVTLSATHCNAVHVKAGFVQLARLVTDSSSNSSSSNRGGEVWQQLLFLLPGQLRDLQSHHCASILWSLGQLQPILGSPIGSGSSSSRDGAGSSDGSSDGCSNAVSMQQQLLQGALAGMGRLNPRLCAQLLHGAARLQLHIPPSGLQLLQQHTQQQLQMCDPQALSCMLWSFATLHEPDHGVMPQLEWLQAFYSSSWKWLQAGATFNSSSSGCNGASTHQQQQQQDIGQPWRHKDTCSSFEPVELSALLTAACRLQLQPPGGWLAAVADSCSRQIGSFQQQELGVLLYCFAKLQYVPPRGLLAAAAARAVQIGPEGFKPHTLSLLLYGMTRSQRWHVEQQQQQQQQQQEEGEAGVQGCVSSLCAVQLDQASAVDLALLAWCMGQQAVRRRQQQQHTQVQQGQAGQAVLPSLLQAATVKLQQQQFTPQGLSMLLWGCGTALQAAAAASSNSGDDGGCAQPSQQQQEPVNQAVLASFVEAAAATALQHAKALSGHELSSVVWGLGALGAAAGRIASSNGTCSSSSSSSSTSTSATRRLPGSVAASECLDVIFCQLLDASDQLSNYQLTATIQGYAWLQHPRGLDLLHTALQSRGHGSRLPTARPQELLVLLRACVQYKYVLDAASWGAVVGAIERMRAQLEGTELAQLLYVLGKLQVLSNRRTKQRAAQAAAAAAAEAAAASSAWSTGREQRRQARVQSQQQRQALQRVVLTALVPDALLEQLLLQAGRCVGQCGSRDVSLMVWGVSQLDRHRQHGHTQQRQHKQAWGSSSVGTVSNSITPGSSSSSSSSSVVAPSGQACACVAQQGVDMVYAPLLSSVYAYTSQQLQSFAPGNLATLLYALQRLHARPDAAWLQAAAMQFTEERLSSMDGQSLAVLALALAGLNWVPTQSWLGVFVRAVAAADKRGALVTTWQRQCISNSVAALNPLAGHAWLPQR